MSSQLVSLFVIYVLPSMQETAFYNHTKHLATYILHAHSILTFRQCFGNLMVLAFKTSSPEVEMYSRKPNPWKPFSSYSSADKISGTPNLVTCKYVRLTTYRNALRRLRMHWVYLHSSYTSSWHSGDFNQWESLTDPGSWKVTSFQITVITVERNWQWLFLHS